MYRLVQAGIIENEELKEHLKLHGYTLAKITQGLWTHKHTDINLTLGGDDFGIR